MNLDIPDLNGYEESRNPIILKNYLATIRRPLPLSKPQILVPCETMNMYREHKYKCNKQFLKQSSNLQKPGSDRFRP